MSVAKAQIWFAVGLALGCSAKPEANDPRCTPHTETASEDQSSISPSPGQQEMEYIFQPRPFVWPKSGIVGVEETLDVGGTRIESKFQLHVCSVEDLLVVRLEEFESRDASDTFRLQGLPVQAVRENPLGLFALAFTVTAEGVLKTLALDSLELANVRERASTVEIDEDTEEMWSLPHHQALVISRMHQIWWGWVQAWHGFNPHGEQRQSFVVEYDNGYRSKEFVVARIGQRRRPLHMRTQRVMGHDQIMRVNGPFMKRYVEEQGYDKGTPRSLEEARYGQTALWEVSFDPKTSRPLWAFREETTTFDMRNGKLPKSTTLRRTHRFDWRGMRDQQPNCVEHEETEAEEHSRSIE